MVSWSVLQDRCFISIGEAIVRGQPHCKYGYFLLKQFQKKIGRKLGIGNFICQAEHFPLNNYIVGTLFYGSLWWGMHRLDYDLAGILFLLFWILVVRSHYWVDPTVC